MLLTEMFAYIPKVETWNGFTESRVHVQHVRIGPHVCVIFKQYLNIILWQILSAVVQE